MASFLSLLYFTILLPFLATVNGSKLQSSDSSVTTIPYDLYHSSDDLLKEINKLVVRHPDTLTIEKLTAGNKGYQAEIAVVTYNDRKNETIDESKFRVLMSFGQHGREIITTEVALHLLFVLAKERTVRTMDTKSFEEMMRNVVLKVVPMENLNGRKLVEEGEFCERRNGRGVDLNRNWSVDWGKKEKDYDPFEENPGTAPFSEPEAQIMRKLSKTFNPHVWITVHSGMEALFMPYDHKNRTPDGHNSHVMRLLLEDLNRRHFKDKCLVGSGGGSVGYLAHGTTTDYMYEIAKVPMSFTFEIFGDLDASPKDCFKMFNPIDKEGYNDVIDKWTAAFLTLLKTGPEWLVNKKMAVPGNLNKLVSSKVVDDLLVQGTESQMEGLEHGLRELRSYFRLFLLSTVLLMFMFCSKIPKGRRDKHIEHENGQPSYVHQN